MPDELKSGGQQQSQPTAQNSTPQSQPVAQVDPKASVEPQVFRYQDESGRVQYVDPKTGVRPGACYRTQDPGEKETR